MNIKSNKKYLLLLPLVVTLIMLTFFSAAYNEIVREKHEEKFITVKKSLNYIVSVFDRFIEANSDWEKYDYTSILTQVFTGIDQMSAIRVVLLTQDLMPITGTFIDDLGTPYDLLNHEEFVKAARESDDSGELTIMINDGTQTPHELFVYFKKIPTGDYNNKLIAVYGVSKYAVEENFAPWLIWGMIGMVAMTVLLKVWMILYIGKLADAERLAKRKG